MCVCLFFLWVVSIEAECEWMTLKEGDREFVCSTLCKASQDLSLPDVTVRVAASWNTGYCFKLQPSVSFSSSPSFFPFFSLFSLSLSPFPSRVPLSFSSSLLHFQLFLEHAAWTREVLHQLSRSWEELSGWTPPSFSLSPFLVLLLSSSLAFSLLPLVWESTPAWFWLHTLRVQLPHRPSQPLHSLIPPLDWILGVKLIWPASSLFA